MSDISTENIDEKDKIEERNTHNFELFHIKELDGIRALFIIMVVWYHIWQQSWLGPVIGTYSFDWLVRNGAIFVDGLILLSGFCLFLPYARSKFCGEKIPDTKGFYIKRIARIVPSYLFAIIIALVFFILPNHEYYSVGFAVKDILSHLFFVHNLIPEVYAGTKILGVLWTVGVEMQLYLLFPFFAKAFLKKPIVTYFAMVVVSLISCTIISINFDNNSAFWINNTLTFICVFANGMLGAYAYVKLSEKIPKKKYFGVIFTIIAIALIFAFKAICDFRMTYGSEQKWQVDFRYLLSFYFLAIILCTILSSKWFRAVFSNRVMKFIAIISFNLYIYHQSIAVRLKAYKIPYWEGETLPNMTNNEEWKIKYFIICVVAALAVATVTTFLIERPLAKKIKKLNKSKEV